MNLIFLLLSLILCLCICIGYSALDIAEIHKCETKQNVSMIPSGSDINICCVLTEEECNKTSPLNQLQILPEEKYTNNATNTNLQMKQNKCSASWLITSASTADSTKYICSINGTIVKTINITVIEKPSSPNFTSILVSDQNDFLIEFDTGQQNPSSDYIVLYRDFQGEKGEKQFCHSNCVSETGKSNTCLCEFDNLEEDFLLSYSLVTLIINVSVPSSNYPVQSIQVEKIISSLDYVVPGCVQEFMVIDVQENKTTVQFRPSRKTKRLIDKMNEERILFYYYVEMWSLDGIQQIFQMNFKKVILFGEDFDLDYSLQFAALEFLDLTSSTTYSISVKAIASGGGGCVRNLNFTTKPRAPEFELFTYSRFISQSNVSIVWLMWKPEDKKGSKRVHYDLELSCGSLPKFSLNTSLTYILELCFSQEPLSVLIWSLTDKDKSKYFSEFHIPAITELLEYSIIIEWMNDSHVLVLANLYDAENIQELALHACKGDRDDSSLHDFCTEYPGTQKYDIKSMSENPGKFVFKLPVETFEVKTFQKNVTCFEYVDRSLMYSSNKKTVVVNVTLNQNKSHDYDWTNADPFDKLRDLTAEDERRSRSVSSTEPSQVNFTQSWQLSTSSLGDSPRFFMSTKKKGIWQGMQQAKCYFSRKFKKANVLVLHENGMIKISQECDSVTPKQFLVNYFEIYSAPSSDCHENERHYLATINNTIFNATLYQLPQDWTFICVIALGSHLSSKTIQFLENPKSSESSNTTTIIILGVLIPLAFISLVVACFVYKCLRSKKYFEKMTRSSKNVSLPNVAEPEPYDIKHTLSKVTCSNDSGLGSSCESTVENSSPLEQESTLHHDEIHLQVMADEKVQLNSLQSENCIITEINNLSDYAQTQITSETYSDSYDMSETYSDSYDTSDCSSMSDSVEKDSSSEPINFNSVDPLKACKDDHYSHLTENTNYSGC